MTLGDVLRLLSERYLTGMEHGFGRPGRMDPRWEGVPPLAAIVWDGYKQVFAFHVLAPYIFDPGDGDEVPSDL